MPKVCAPAGYMTVAEAAQRIVHDEGLSVVAETVAAQLRRACEAKEIHCVKRRLGKSRTAKLVKYGDARQWWRLR